MTSSAIESVLGILYDLPPWWMGATIVPPDWPEGDPRWSLSEAMGRNETALQALDSIRDVLERDRKAMVRRYADGGMTRPMIASALGMTLSELRDWMGWP